MAYCTALEKRHTSGYREFESRTFRKLCSGCLEAKTAVLHTVHRRFESYSEHNIRAISKSVLPQTFNLLRWVQLPHRSLISAIGRSVIQQTLNLWRGVRLPYG